MHIILIQNDIFFRIPLLLNDNLAVTIMPYTSLIYCQQFCDCIFTKILDMCPQESVLEWLLTLKYFLHFKNWKKLCQIQQKLIKFLEIIVCTCITKLIGIALCVPQRIKSNCSHILLTVQDALQHLKNVGHKI